MTTTRNLQTFIRLHERKLNAKLTARRETTAAVSKRMAVHHVNDIHDTDNDTCTINRHAFTPEARYFRFIPTATF